MKISSFFTTALLLAFLGSQLFVATAQAQVPTLPVLDYCDDMLPTVKMELERDANAQCKTMYACVECMIRKSNQPVYAFIMAHPTSADCQPLKQISNKPEPASRGDEAATKARFVVDILQSPCINGGNNLEVFIPGWDADSREFSYAWEVDGKKAGHLNRLACVCGKEAKVFVTHVFSGRRVVKAIRLNDCKPTDR